MRKLIATLFAGLVLVAAVAPAANARPWEPFPGPAPCICPPPVEIA